MRAAIPSDKAFLYCKKSRVQTLLAPNQNQVGHAFIENEKKK